MEEVVFDLVEAKNYDQALVKALQCVERITALEDVAAMDALSRGLQMLTLKLLDEGQDEVVNTLLSRYLNLRGVLDPLRTRHLNQLGVGEGLKRAIYQMKFAYASKIVETFGFLDDKAVFNFFFTEIVRNRQHKFAIKWIREKNDPNFYTEEKLVAYFINQGLPEAALKIIKDLNLYDVSEPQRNAFDVPSLILQVMKKGGVKESIMYMKMFKLKDENDLDNTICPQFSEPMIVKALLQSLEWSYALGYIGKSKFSASLSQMFPIRSMIKLMMRMKDWAALSVFLSKDQFKEALEDKEGEEPCFFKKELVSSLIQDQEIAQAARYALKFDVAAAFPIKDLLEKLIRRHEFGALNSLIKNHDLSSEMVETEKEVQINKILALKHFRRRYGTTPMTIKPDKKSVVVKKVLFSSVDLTVKGQLVPFQDDKFLVHTENCFFKFLKDSNTNIDLCQNVSEPFAPRVSPRLQQFVERKMQSQKTSFNAHAEEWSPSMSRISSTPSAQGLAAMKSYDEQPERVSEKLHRAMNGPTHSGMAVPPGLDFHRSENSLYRHNSTGGINQRPRAYQQFQRQGSFSRNVSSVNQHTMQSQSMESYDLRARMQRQREIEQIRLSPHLRSEREDIHYRDKVEKLIAGLLNLNKEAQEVQRELTNLSMQYKRALNEKNEYEIDIIQKNYRRLRMVKEKHKAKEKRVLEAAQTDACVREAVAEFQRRRKAITRQQNYSPHMASQSEQQTRQLLRLRQHEMEKQRQIQKLRAQQQQEERFLQMQQQQRMTSRMNTQFYRNEHHGSGMALSSPPLEGMQGRMSRPETNLHNGFPPQREEVKNQEFMRRKQPLQNYSEEDYFDRFQNQPSQQKWKEESFGFDFGELNINASKMDAPEHEFGFTDSAFASDSFGGSNGMLNSSSFDFGQNHQQQ